MKHPSFNCLIPMSVTLFCILLTGQIFAQSHVRLAYGTSIPIGNFQQTTLEDDKFGFAGNGREVNLSVSAGIGDNATSGFVVKLGYGEHDFNTEAYQLLSRLNNSNFNNPDFKGEWSVQAGDYQHFTIAAGARVAAGDSIVKFHLSLLGGMLDVKKPQIRAIGRSLAQPSAYIQTEEKAKRDADFLINLNTGVNYKLSDLVMLSLYTGYHITDLKYNNVSKESFIHTTTENDVFNNKQNYNMPNTQFITILGGVGIVLE